MEEIKSEKSKYSQRNKKKIVSKIKLMFLKIGLRSLYLHQGTPELVSIYARQSNHLFIPELPS